MFVRVYTSLVKGGNGPELPVDVGISFDQGDLVIFELDLPARGLRSATLVVDERTFESLG